MSWNLTSFRTQVFCLCIRAEKRYVPESKRRLVLFAVGAGGVGEWFPWPLSLSSELIKVACSRVCSQGKGCWSTFELWGCVRRYLRLSASRSIGIQSYNQCRFSGCGYEFRMALDDGMKLSDKVGLVTMKLVHALKTRC